MMKLPAGWYAFASPKELSWKKPNSLRRFGIDWVVWRSLNKTWVAQEDRCPHRSAKLSLGRIVGNCIECPFHGFRFDSEGICTFVPEIKRDSPGLKLESYVLTEKYNFFWINWGNSQSSEIPWFSELENGVFSYSSHTSCWKKHFSRCVESQLDYVHLPFVHSNSIGRGFDPSRSVTWKLQDSTIRVYLGDEGPTTGYFEFRYPNIWKLSISPKMVQTLMFVPVDENETWIYSRAYHCFTRVPILREWMAWFFAQITNPYILAQDRRVVLSQDPDDVRNAHGERLFPSDRAIIAFRKWFKGVNDVS